MTTHTDSLHDSQEHQIIVALHGKLRDCRKTLEHISDNIHGVIVMKPGDSSLLLSSFISLRQHWVEIDDSLRSLAFMLGAQAGIAIASRASGFNPTTDVGKDMVKSLDAALDAMSEALKTLIAKINS